MFGDIDDDELNNSINVESLYGGEFIFVAPRAVTLFRFWSTTEELTSEVYARVQEWENAMLPILEEEETRKDFDIHEYGDELLDMFHEVGEVKTLDELLAGRKRYEVSRYFLACLMMANTQNVRVECDVRVDENGSRSSITKVTLLKKDRHHEVFDREGAL
ncbi:unnamed protein product [Angiostrongylus costaricensis]|uniref:CNDH2_C domain-containing protein n=1 Tax=Angiostrongylus costaricensis TaxID=334426 RepID=A0A0R3PHH2_ANGCS|nr:unnamed protein product [Angiostrongylus costaricensis]